MNFMGLHYPQTVEFYNNSLHKKSSDAPQRHSYPSGMDDDTLKIECGKRLAAARAACKLTQAELCSGVPGLEVSRLSNYETGIRQLPIEIAKKIAPVLGVSAGYLLTLEDKEEDAERIKALVALYKSSDQRGQATILRVAQQESDYTVDDNDNYSRAS